MSPNFNFQKIKMFALCFFFSFLIKTFQKQEPGYISTFTKLTILYYLKKKKKDQNLGMGERRNQKGGERERERKTTIIISNSLW